MKPLAKIALVLAAYLAALAIASIVVAIHVAATRGPDRDLYGAMYDFGDLLLFLGVSALAALPASGAALYFLRQRPLFWISLSLATIALAATGVVALTSMLVPSMNTPAVGLRAWLALSPIRILAAPLFALFFVMAGVMAPARASRRVLFSAAVLEVVAFASVALRWYQSNATP
jgi:hypothetical protein